MVKVIQKELTRIVVSIEVQINIMFQTKVMLPMVQIDSVVFVKLQVGHLLVTIYQHAGSFQQRIKGTC